MLTGLFALLKVVNWSRVFGWAMIPLALCLALGGIWLSGERHGEHQVQAKWDVATQAQKLVIAELQGKILSKEAAHQQEAAAVSDQLRKTEAIHEQTVAALRADLVGRLRVSDARAAEYQRRAASGPAECRDLAGHTAGLDSALEQGVGLVGELEAALGQREAQLRLVGQQLQDDRKLVDGP